MFTAAQRVAGEHPEANPCAPGGEWLSTLRCSHTVKPYSGTERDEPEVRAASGGVSKGLLWEKSVTSKVTRSTVLTQHP